MEFNMQPSANPQAGDVEGSFIPVSQSLLTLGDEVRDRQKLADNPLLAARARQKKGAGNLHRRVPSSPAMPSFGVQFNENDFPPEGRFEKQVIFNKEARHTVDLRGRKMIIPQTQSMIKCFPDLNPKHSRSPFGTHSQLPKILNSQSGILSSKSFCPTMCPFKTVVFQFHLSSNWGGGNTMSLSEIDILDDKRQILPIIDIKSYPSSQDAAKVVSGQLIKKKPSDCWRQEFDPGKGIVLIISCQASSQPCFARLWNNDFDRDTAVKHYQVFMNDEFIVENDLPANFGQIVPLVKPLDNHKADIKKIMSMFDENIKTSPYLGDSYGKLPTNLVSSIRIHVLDHYSDQPEIGLNAITLLDLDGYLISVPDSSIISTFGIRSETNLRNLLTDNPNRSEPSKMWRGIITDPSDPYIEITLNPRIHVGAIKIYNYNGSGESCEQGIKKIKVEVNRKPIYTGFVKKASGHRFDVDTDSKTVTLFHSATKLLFGF